MDKIVGADAWKFIVALRHFFYALLLITGLYSAAVLTFWYGGYLREREREREK